MTIRFNDQQNFGFQTEGQQEHTKPVISKFDYELYDEEKNLVEKVFRVKRTQLPNNGEKWRIFQDTKTVFVVDGSKISKKEREFLRTPEGFSFLIAQSRDGIQSLNKLKTELKRKLR